MIADARKPPKGATTDAKSPKQTAWSWIGAALLNEKPNATGSVSRTTNASPTAQSSGSCHASVSFVAGHASQRDFAKSGAVWYLRGGDRVPTILAASDCSGPLEGHRSLPAHFCGGGLLASGPLEGRSSLGRTSAVPAHFCGGGLLASGPLEGRCLFTA